MLVPVRVIVIAFFAVLFSNSTLSIELKRDVEKSPNDHREYAYFTLPNALQVMVISDPETDKAAASLDIRVGSADDPVAFPGLAHFLEHMLFLGTHKYPDPDEYQKYISEHGGGHNAYTAPQNTNYFFDVNADYLEGALDRFAQQFTAPLFNQDYVEREVNAVHSEFSSKIQDDGRRYLESLKQSLAPNHPLSKFAVGNLDTLVDREEQSLRSALLDFYDNEYSANRMRLTVLGREDLETLAKWVESRFSAVANKNLPVREITQAYFPGGFLPAKLTVETIMDTRNLSLNFPIPSTREYIHSQPMGYLANLIGHEGPGSLLSALKEQQLVDSLSAGTQFDTGTHAFFNISMSLTEEGLKKQNQIIETVFSYIALLNKHDVKERYFDEQAKLASIGFKFLEKAKPLGYVRGLSSALHHYAPNKALSTGYKLNDFDPELIKRFLGYLKPDNLFVSLRAKNVETDQVTQWFKAPYKLESLSISLTNALRKSVPLPSLALPEPNEFIPDNTDLITATNNAIPQKLPASKGIELWHSTDTEFGTPKSTFFLSIRSPYAMNNVENLLMTQLMVSMLIDNLVEFSYSAYLAGLSYDLYKHVRGITLKISGYNDKQEVLLETILKRIRTSELREDRFANMKERLQRSLENQKQRKPFQQTIQKLQEQLLTPSWSTEEQLVALQDIDLAQLKVFKSDFFSTIDTAILSNGNVAQSQTEEMARLVEKNLIDGAKIQYVEKAKIRRLEGDQNWASSVTIDHPDTSMVYYMQGSDKSYAERARYAVLSQALGTDYYAQLRTEKQLGYIVFASPYPILDVSGIAFIVQSPNTSADVLVDETSAFLSAQKEVIATLNEQDFERYKKAVVSRLEEKETNIGQRSNRYWNEIDKKNAQFDSKQQVIDAVTSLKLDEFKDFYLKRAEKIGANLIVVSGALSGEAAAEEAALSTTKKKGEPSELSVLLNQDKQQERFESLSTFENEM